MPEVNVSSWNLGFIIALVVLVLFILLVILGRVDLIVGLGIAALALAIMMR